MELKRILAKDTKSATERAMALYGRNVLVISNHTVGGQTELVVALDIEEQSLAATMDEPLHKVAPAPSPTDFMYHMAKAQSKPVADVAMASEVPGKKEPVLQPLADERDYLRSREIMSMIREELATLRREFSLNQKTSGWESSLNLTPEVEALLASFTHSGMPNGLRTLLLDTVKDMKTSQEALTAVRSQLEQAMRRPSVAFPQNGVHLIAGPTGAGKTMMALRLASYAADQIGNEKVAIICYNDDRLGAWEQTEVLARQAGVDCFRAENSAALGTVLNKLADRGLILIDTAGAQVPERVAEIQSICPACVVHALVAADSSSATLRRTLCTSGIRWNSLMVSKLDESVLPWPLVEFLCDNFLSLSAASDGTDMAALRRELGVGELVDMALAQISRNPESVAKSQWVETQPAAMPHFATAFLGGARGPFN